MKQTSNSIGTKNSIFLIVVLTISLMAHLFIYWGFFAQLDVSENIKNLFIGLTFLNFILIISYFLFRRNSKVPFIIYFFISLSVGVMFCFLLATLLYQIIGFLIQLIFNQEYMTYWGFLVVTITIIYILYGIYKAYKAPFIKRISLEMKDLSIPLRVIQLSDIHIGGLIQNKELKKMIELVNETKPDIIALTGDIVDTKLYDAIDIIAEFKNLKSKYGIFYILGNHEYFYDTQGIISAFQKLKFNVLLNDNFTIINDEKPLINIAGINDFMGRVRNFLTPDLNQALKDIPQDIPTILLSHQPKVIQELQNQRVDLILSGHTHGGQIFPFSFAVLLQQPFIKGLYTLSNQTKLYINQGSGFWGPPMRIGTDSEITLLDLKPKC